MKARRGKRMLTALVLLMAVFSLTAGVRAQEGKATRYNAKTTTRTQGLSSPKVSVVTPYLTSVKNVTGGVKLTWSKSTGASGYLVYRAYREDTSFTTIKTITKASTLSYTDKTAKSGKEYCYSIIAYKTQDGSRYYSGHDTYGTYIYYLTRPQVTSLASAAKGVTVRWSVSSGAGGYVLYRKLYGASKYSRLKAISASKSSYTDTTAVNGKKYTYTIKAYKKGQSGTSNSAVNSTGKTITYKKPSSGSSGSSSIVYRALLVGESAYTPSRFNLGNALSDSSNNLYGPYYDVRVMRAMLNGMNYSSVIMKENLGKSAVLSAIRSAFSGADSNDVSLFYYTGHGSTTKDSTYSGSLYLTDQESITMSELASALKNVNGRVVVMMDSCGSGAGISSSTGAVGASEDSKYTGSIQDDFDPEIFNESVIAAFAGAGSGEKLSAPKYRELVNSGKFFVITASKVYEISQDVYYNGCWGSAFTRGIVNGGGYQHGSSSYGGSMPADSNNNKSITLEEAYTYAKNRAALLVEYISNYTETQHVIRYPANSGLVVYKKK